MTEAEVLANPTAKAAPDTKPGKPLLEIVPQNKFSPLYKWIDKRENDKDNCGGMLINGKSNEAMLALLLRSYVIRDARTDYTQLDYISTLRATRISRRTLIVAPKSRVDVWKAAIDRELDNTRFNYLMYNMPPAKREAYDLRDYDVVVVAGSIMSREYSVARSGQLLRDSWHRIIIDSPHTCKSSSVLMAAYQALVAQCKWFLVTDYDMLPLNQLKQMEKFPKLMSFTGDLDQYTCWVDRKANETATTEAQSTDDAYSKPVSKEIEAKPLLAKCFNGSDHKPTKKAGDTKPTPTKIANNTKSAPTKTADDTKPTLTKMANDTMPAPTKKTGDTKSAPTAVIPAPKPIMKQIQDQSAQPVALTEHFHCVGLIPEEERFYKRSPALLSLERKHIDAGLNDTEERADDKKDRSDGIVRSAFDQIVYAQLYTLYEIFHKRYGKPRTNRSSIEVTRSSLSEALKKTAEIIQKIHEEDPLAKMFVVVNKFADADVITKHLHDKTDIKNTAMKLSSLPSSRTKDLSMFALLDNLVVLFTSAVTDLDAISLPFVRHFIIVEKWWLYKDPASIVRVARDGIKEHEIKVHRVVYTEPVVQNTLKVNFRKRFLDDSYRAFRPMIALMEYANWGVPDTKEEVGEQT